MAGLKPIGSEKLQGMDKINRILEISRYKETKPQPVNEDKSVEYRKTLADGYEYQIVKEKNGYVIKKSLNEGLDYLEPMKNRKYYSSYSQAFKRLNLITKEVNINEGQESNVSLFENAANEATKYILKFGETKEQAPVAAAPAPVPAPAPAPAPSPEMSPEAPADDMPMDAEMDVDMEVDAEETDDEPVTYKVIQKLTGKLAQKIRAFNDDEEKEESMSSKDIKYVINSVLSALNLNDLEEDDIESIINKLEGVEEEGLEGGEEEMDVDMEVDSEEPVEPTMEPEGEMAEEMDMGNSEEFVDYLFSDVDGSEEMSEEDGYMSKMEEMIEGMFTESKVDNVLKKYFKTSENEKVIAESKKSKLSEKLESVCESKSQLMASKKLVNKYPDFKLVGKTVNKNLVFESNNRQIKISKNGQIL
jgi:hypothetical protein